MNPSFLIGEPIPNGAITISSDNGREVVEIHDLFRRKKVLLFAVPGAFTKNCSAIHFPGFVENEEKLRYHGFEFIACLAVNDTDVMKSWNSTYERNSILMISDGDASYVKSLGLDLNEGIEAGIRSHRFAMILEDLIITHFWHDKKGVVDTHAEKILSVIQNNSSIN